MTLYAFSNRRLHIVNESSVLTCNERSYYSYDSGDNDSKRCQPQIRKRIEILKASKFNLSKEQKQPLKGIFSFTLNSMQRHDLASSSYYLTGEFLILTGVYTQCNFNK